MTSTLPVAKQISTLDLEISRLTDQLRENGEALVLRCIETLLTAGFAFPPSIAPENGPKVYAYALAHLPFAAIDRAARRLIRGEYERSEQGFLPKPPEFAQFARREARLLAEDRQRLIDRRDSLRLAHERPPAPDEAAKKRIRALVAAATASLSTPREEAP